MDTTPDDVAAARVETNDGTRPRRSFIKLAGAAAVGGGAVLAGTGTAEAATTIDGGSAAVVNDVVRARRGTAAQWATGTNTLALGEIGVETDTGRVKFGNSATPTAWGLLPYADAALNSHLNQEVTLDGLPTTTALKGSEKVLGLLAAGPARDTLFAVSDLSTFHRADMAQILSAPANIATGTTLVVGNVTRASDGSNDPYQLRLPQFVAPTYADRPGALGTWRTRVVQYGSARIELTPTLVNGQPDPLVSVTGFALTKEAADAAAANPPRTAMTRLRTKGQFSVVHLEAALVIFGKTFWVVSGDVEVF